MEFTYLKQPPRRYTFEQPELKAWVEGHCVGVVLNLFAGRTLLNVNEVRVDVDESTPADYHVDAYEFLSIAQYKQMSFNTVILDPPYNLRKSREKYGDRQIGSFTKIKDALPALVADGGVVITLGYDTVGMSRSRGFDKVAICVICHGGDVIDTLCVVERKVDADIPL